MIVELDCEVFISIYVQYYNIYIYLLYIYHICIYIY